jgi:hypothetical protein
LAKKEMEGICKKIVVALSGRCSALAWKNLKIAGAPKLLQLSIC